MSEYFTYVKNKDVKGIQYSHVDDVRVYKFIDEIYAMSANNQIFPFDSMPQLITYLREQWAGLFERFLDGEAQVRLVDMMNKMEQVTSTLEGLAELYRTTSTSGDSDDKNRMMDEILIQNHPLFSAMRKLLRVRYRLFFTNEHEMDEWLRYARAGKKLVSSPKLWDEEDRDDFTVYNVSMGKDTHYIFQVSKSLFDENKSLKPMLPGDWDDSLISLVELNTPGDDDEIPF